MRLLRLASAALGGRRHVEAVYTDRVPSQRVLMARTNRESTMLYYAVVFLIIALIAGALGFLGIAGAAVGIAKILFFVFLVLFVVSLIVGRRGRGPPVV